VSCRNGAKSNSSIYNSLKLTPHLISLIELMRSLYHSWATCLSWWYAFLTGVNLLSERVLGKYLKELLESSTEMTRCGCALALGALPQSFLCGRLDVIIAKLLMASKMTSKHTPFVLSRRDCLKALTRYCWPSYWTLCNCILADVTQEPILLTML